MLLQMKVIRRKFQDMFYFQTTEIKNSIFIMINPKGSSEAVLKVDNKDTVTLTELPALELLVRRLQLGLVLDETPGKQIRIEEIVTVIDQDVMDSAVIGQGHVNYDVIDKDQVNHAVIGQNQVGSNLMVEVKKDAIKETAKLEMMEQCLPQGN